MRMPVVAALPTLFRLLGVPCFWVDGVETHDVVEVRVALLGLLVLV